MSVGVPYSDKQTLIDEDEDDIYAAMNKNVNKKNKFHRRDSQNIKKSIIESFNELEQQKQQIIQQKQMMKEQQNNNNKNNKNDSKQKQQENQIQEKEQPPRQRDTYDLL